MATIITTTTTRIEYCKEHGWNSNTDLCMDVKTLLRNDRRTKLGKDYQGVLTRDKEGHYSFVETIGLTDGKRNPHVFFGRQKRALTWLHSQVVWQARSEKRSKAL